MDSYPTKSYSLREQVRSALKAYARSYLHNLLQKSIATGSVQVIEGKEITVYGSHVDEEPQAKIIVLNDEFWLKVFMRHDLGFSEAYMDGDFQTPDLKAVLTLVHLNRDQVWGSRSFISFMLSFLSSVWIWLFGQTITNCKMSCIRGYDNCNEFHSCFLSEEMTYSSAIWPESIGGVRGDLDKGPFPGDLEAGQLAKIHHVLRSARIKPGHRVLELGSGWGAAAIEAAKLGCTVDTITLSIEQQKLAQERIRALGLEDRITVHLIDYRQLPADFEGQFDALISIEMAENVGDRHMGEFFKIVDWALKSKDATAVITISTQPEWRFSRLQPNDYAREYQWPGFHNPSSTSFIDHCYKAVNGRLSVTSIDDWTHHYPRTLREWGRRLQANWNEKIEDALIKHQPKLAEGDNLAVFKRRFEYMYVYCEVTYVNSYMYLKNFTFERPLDVAALSG